MNARIRAVDQGPRGEVYLLQDGDGAKLLRLDPAR
jgi:glucose/arabinose dehydrogenase